MLPINFLSHTCKYSLKINGVNIQARVLENYKELVDSGVAELRSRLDTSFPIVGFDLKHVKPSDSQKNSGNGIGNTLLLLVLHVKDLCLVLKLAQYNDYHDSLLSFLNDKSICFLGWEFSVKLNLIGCTFKQTIRSSVNNVGSFAARVMKIRELERGIKLVEFASKVGAAPAIQEDEASQIMKKTIEIPYNYQNISDVCFIGVEVKSAVLDAYWCYAIGTKLMSISHKY